MVSKWTCPIPYISLSFDTGGRQRLCCHDQTDYSEIISIEEVPSDITKQPLNYNIINQFENGEVPKNCEFCLTLEKKNCYSPRQEYLEKFNNIDLNKGKVHYLDLTLTNECNLKCRSCKPKYSHLIEKEYKKLEISFSLETPSGNSLEISEYYSKLINLIVDNGHLTITGGEPFIIPRFQSLIEQIIDKKINLRLFTNITHLPNWFLEALPRLYNVEFIISIDGDESINNLVRYPSNFSKIDKNLETLANLKLQNFSVRFHTVLQAYNLKNIITLLEYLYKFRASFPFVPEFTQLKHPKMLSPSIFSRGFLIGEMSELNNKIKVLKSKLDIHSCFYEINLKSINNLIAQLNSISSENSPDLTTAFLIFTKKLDLERRQNTFKILPWLKEALNE